MFSWHKTAKPITPEHGEITKPSPWGEVQRHGKTFLGRPSFAECWQCVYHSFQDPWPGGLWYEDCYLLRSFLPKLAKPTSLIQIYAINSASSFIYIQWHLLSVQLYIINKLRFQDAVLSPAKSSDCVCLFFLALLLWSGLSLESCWM